MDQEEECDAFPEQALRAWQSYQDTGVHAIGEAVVAWLESWGSDDELPAPECQAQRGPANGTQYSRRS